MTARRALAISASARVTPSWAIFTAGLSRKIVCRISAAFTAGWICEIAGEVRERKFGLADDGSEDAPSAQLFLLLGEDGERGLVGFDLRLQDVGLIGLADVEKLAGGFDGVLRESAEFAADFEHFLRGERLVVGDAHAIFDAQALFGGFG